MFGRYAIAGFAVASLWHQLAMAQHYGAVHQRIHAKTERQLFVKSIPNAACVLNDVDSNAKESGLNVFTDGYGIARIGTYAETAGTSRTMVLTCRDTSGRGAVATTPIEIRAVRDSDAVGAETDYLEALPPFGKVLQPLNGDLSRYSDEYLESNGYPARPGERTSVEHEDWEKLVRRPMTRVPDVLIPNPSLHNDVENSANWAGYQLKNAVCGTAAGYTNPVWWNVSGQWDVANTSYPAGTTSSTRYALSQWVGIGGTTSTSALAQTGTTVLLSCTSYGLCASVTSVWVEYLCSANLVPAQVVPGISANFNNHFAASVTMVDAGGSTRSKYGPKARFNIHNSTTGAQGSVLLSLPSGCNVVGEAAEWVYERPRVSDGSRSRLLKFNNGQMQYAFARSADKNSTAYCPYEQRVTPSANFVQVTMVGDSGAPTLATSTYGGTNTHGSYFNFVWSNYN